MAARIADSIIGAIELALGLRLLLILFGANANAGFVAWLYAITDSLMQPFIGIFPAWHLADAFILDVSTLVAMLVYAIFGWVVIQLIYFVLPSRDIVETRNIT
ncbi:YggT family protein [Candidatus Kaiserbacteria bacterium]|nr:YggT family protein [Candidatus Kaiserbacteria bacterium]